MLPPSPYLKVNMDTLWVSKMDRIAINVVVWDSNGQVIDGLNKVDKSMSFEVLESIALAKGIRLVGAHGWEYVLF